MRRRPLTVRLAAGSFALCLRLLPRGLRTSSGAEMRAMFVTLASEARRRGGDAALARTWIGSMIDLLRQLPEQHRAERRMRRPVFPSSRAFPSPRLQPMNLLSDLRYAVRGLARTPLPTIVVVLTLTVGIGASTAVFTLVNGIVLRPLEYPDAGELFIALDVDRDGVGGPISYPDFIDATTRVEAIQAGAAYDEWRTNLTGAGEPERLDGAQVNAGFFDVLGVRPELGRFFLPAEDIDGNDRVVVLSHGLWQRKFGADPAVVGQAVELDGREHTIVGVAPRDFEDPRLSGASWGAPALWRPLGYGGLPEERMPGRSGHSYTGIVRLRDGVGRDRAQEELDALMAGLAGEFPETNADKGMVLQSLHQHIAGPSSDSLWLLLGAVGLLLVIAVANVAGLMIARAADRTRETALRVAIGARGARLASLFLAEGAVLAAAGATLGVGLALVLRQAILAAGADFLSRTAPFDTRVLMFTAAVAAATALCSALAPLWHVRRMDLLPAITASGPSVGGGRTLLRRLLVTGEVALAIVLLCGAALLGRSLWNLTAVDPGIRTDRLLVFELTLPSARYGEPGDAGRFFDSLREGLEARPEIEGVATINILPLSGSFDCSGIEPVDGPPVSRQDRLCPEIRTVSPGYASVAGVELLAGRFLSGDDTAEVQPVAVVSRSLGRALWPDAPSPVGRRLRRGDGAPEVEVVGVVAEVAHDRLDRPVPTLYLAHAQGLISWHQRRAVVLVRTQRDPLASASSAVTEVRELDPLLPVANLRSMQQVVANTVTSERFRAMLLAAFASSAILLAAIGVYGAIAYAVTRQRHEMAIRAALGAGRGRVLAQVLRSGLGPVVAGTMIGLLVAVAGGSVLEGMLYGVEATDPVALAVVAAVLLIVGVVASWFPALRAGRVDPAEALRDG